MEKQTKLILEDKSELETRLLARLEKIQLQLNIEKNNQSRSQDMQNIIDIKIAEKDQQITNMKSEYEQTFKDYKCQIEHLNQ